MQPAGSYTAARAAALSGVPLSTVHHWAREGVIVPSVSPQRVKLWSYADLMGLRLVAWLRRPKRGAGHEAEIRGTPMRQVRSALARIADLDLELWSEDGGPAVAVDRAGDVVLRREPHPERISGQTLVADAEELVVNAEIASAVGGGLRIHGPDLRAPRRRLRIVPLKLGGAPHLVGTRVESEAVGALRLAGLERRVIHDLYPDLDPDALDEAAEFEAWLSEAAAPPVAA